MDQEKRRFRKLKRDVKRAGGRMVRRQLKRDLTETPEEAPHSPVDYGHRSSQTMNGNDRDATRRQDEEE
ncbi:MAG: hypothetical protein K2R98_28765 [Gemmataceae bacterium]|nr:hypothetical protein [Gemmataceae bacterium]